MEDRGAGIDDARSSAEFRGMTIARRIPIRWLKLFATVFLLVGLFSAAGWWWNNRPPAGLIMRLEADEGNFSTVVVSRDGSRLAAGTASGKVLLWDIPDGTPATLFQYSQQPVTALATTADGFLIAATLSKRMLVWDLQTLKARAIPPLAGLITCIAAHPLRTELAIGFSDGTLQLLDTKSAEFTTVPSDHRGSVKVLAYDPHGEFLVSGGEDGAISVRDATTRELLRTLSANGEVSSLCFSRDGQRLVSGTWNGDVAVWNARGNQRLHHFQHGDSVSGVGIAGERVVSGGWDHYLRFWSLRSREPIAMYDTEAAIHALAIGPDDKTVMTVSRDNRVDVWKVP